MSAGLKYFGVYLVFLKFLLLSQFFLFLNRQKSVKHRLNFPGKHSAGDLPEIVFGLVVILYTLRNCWMLLSSVSRPLFFFNVLLNVSTNLLACPLTLDGMKGVVTCSIDNDQQKFLNSFPMNWVLLSLTIFFWHAKMRKTTLLTHEL